MNLQPNIYLYHKDINNFYIQRDDLLSFSFGGNKLRKNIKFFKEIIDGNYTHVVTYGSKSSNHSRIVANLSARYNLKCTVITPKDNENATYNSSINDMLNAKVIYTPLNEVKNTIKETLEFLVREGEKPYFIQGGAHGLQGTQAYVEAFKYIMDFSNKNDLKFDYIFLASGTGATQAGLIIGNHENNYLSEIIGISVARDSNKGRKIIEESIQEYFENKKEFKEFLRINFNDNYLSNGYGKFNENIISYIDKYMKIYGIPLDTTYTGKAVFGMHDYIKRNDIKNKNILFIHTGGTPLYFDYLKEVKNV